MNGMIPYLPEKGSYDNFMDSLSEITINRNKTLYSDRMINHCDLK